MRTSPSTRRCGTSRIFAAWTFFAVRRALDAHAGTLDLGLIHADLVRDTLLVDGERIRLLDLDDGRFGHRPFDLATVLLKAVDPPDRAAHNARFVADASEHCAAVLRDAVRERSGPARSASREGASGPSANGSATIRHSRRVMPNSPSQIRVTFDALTDSIRCSWSLTRSWVERGADGAGGSVGTVETTRRGRGIGRRRGPRCVAGARRLISDIIASP